MCHAIDHARIVEPQMRLEHLHHHSQNEQQPRGGEETGIAP
jgi:hypothetical protein